MEQTHFSNAKETNSLLTHLTDILTTLITNLYVSTGLLGIVLAMAIESCCIPLPSELVMPLAGIMIVNGKLLHGTNSLVALLLVALAGAAGCLLGSIVAYIIGYTGGRPLSSSDGEAKLPSSHACCRWYAPTFPYLPVSQKCLLPNSASIPCLAHSHGAFSWRM